jgi:hypothetical protein
MNGVTTHLFLNGNRIYAGLSTGGGGGTMGVFASSGTVSSAGSLIAINNMIHGGTTGAGVPLQLARALETDDLATVILEDNTLYAGDVAATGGASGHAWGAQLTGGSHAILRGNIFAGPEVDNATYQTDAIVFEDCETPPLLVSNLFVDADRGSTSTGLTNLIDIGSCFGGKSPPSLTGLEAMDSGAKRNFSISAACVPADLEAGVCADCPSTGCLPWLLSGWVPTASSSGVLDAGSWSLRDGAPCAITGGGAELLHVTIGPAIPADIADAARPFDASSMGAFQYTGHCSAP